MLLLRKGLGMTCSYNSCIWPRSLYSSILHEDKCIWHPRHKRISFHVIIVQYQINWQTLPINIVNSYVTWGLLCFPDRKYYYDWWRTKYWATSCKLEGGAHCDVNDSVSWLARIIKCKEANYCSVLGKTNCLAWQPRRKCFEVLSFPSAFISC